ncbi:MAG: hypothetical protein KDA20_11065 [Phycisphaerales bacterium]|nr:hypothetical protein [Phycisphaerales bacterium]
MDLSNPAVLMSAMFIGVLGLGVFIYGKRQSDLKCLGVGLALCIFPYFVSSLIVLWATTGACLGALFLLPRLDV